VLLDFLYNLRSQGLVVGIGDWLGFLEALQRGLAGDLAGYYRLGRALICRSEADFDAYDVAFGRTYGDLDVPDGVREQLEQWLSQTAERPDLPWAPHDFESLEDLWRELFERLGQQDGEHHGGNWWVGTGGTSPFGHSGRGANGIRIGGSGGGRQAVAVAMERRWENYRTDRAIETRDLKVALRALRKLVREGQWELDLDATIDATCRNAGEIDLVEQRSRDNQVRLVLFMDTGGSMSPHARRVEQLFTAASEMRTFRSFDHYFFHNCVYDRLYTDYEQLEHVATSEVLDQLTPRHRLVLVGDASMAPWELFSARRWYGSPGPAGIGWLRRLRERCPASVWLNPDAPRFWRHPTVEAIGAIFPMFELSVDGLRAGIRKLRAPV